MNNTRLKQTEVGLIPEDWEVKELHQISQIKTGRGCKKLKVGKFKIIGSNGLIGFTNSYLEEGSFIYTGRVGTIGQINFLKNDRYWISDNVIYLKTDKLFNLKYLYYSLSRIDFSYLNVGSTQPLVKQSDFKKIKIAVPISEQERDTIAKILSDLDEKIELNRKMNQTLEEIGKALFKHWFIDFEFPNEKGEPYKSNGGKMVYNEELKKEIPKGWAVKNYGDLLEFERGIEPGSKNYLYRNEKDTILFYRVGDLSSGESKIYVKKEIIKNKISNFENILISFDGTVGKVKIGVEGSYSTGIRKVYDKNGVFSNAFIFYLMKSKFIQNKIKEFAKGTTIIHAGESIKYLKTAIPIRNIIINFNLLINSIYLKLLNNKKEIYIIKKIRDLLLPKLMSGKIRVKY